MPWCSKTMKSQLSLHKQKRSPSCRPWSHQRERPSMIREINFGDKLLFKEMMKRKKILQMHSYMFKMIMCQLLQLFRRKLRRFLFFKRLSLQPELHSIIRRTPNKIKRLLRFMMKKKSQSSHQRLRRFPSSRRWSALPELLSMIRRRRIGINRLRKSRKQSLPPIPNSNHRT